MIEKDTKPQLFQRAWNIFSAIAGVIGTAGMVDDIANWASLIQVIVHDYQELTHPILKPITDILNMPLWFTDYIFVGLMVVSARTRPTFNHMKSHWLIDISSYRWFEFWAPHRIAVLILSVFLVFLWPLVLITFLPPSVLKIDKANHFQRVIWREQFHWLAIYILTFIGLFIANAGLKSLALEVLK